MYYYTDYFGTSAKTRLDNSTKKNYATLENARRLTALEEGGDISDLFSNDTTLGNTALSAFAKHMNIVKNCGTNKGCWYDGMKYLNNSYYDIFDSNGSYDSGEAGAHGKAILADGTLIDFYSRNNGCNTNSMTAVSPSAYAHYCGIITVDVNGKEKPNTFGKDVFLFDITRDGIFPTGTAESDETLYWDCYAQSQGWGCASKVIKENAENYY